ncbi:MAG: carboxypeptidase regulatory-like domain-containing protein [Acidobacteria bacterium]|nr:carboxypeptidase regulatory-like domain-containing protein [Acidobacteriota bacterium]
MKSQSNKVFVFLILLLALAAPVFAQTPTTGAITGRAVDASEALIPGVEVIISSPAMIGGSRTALTDEQGTYRFTLLPAVLRPRSADAECIEPDGEHPR